MRVLIALLVLCGVAGATPPKGYKCGPGGYRVKDTCKCPIETIPDRDADDKAICAPKPEPKPEACLADRAGKQPVKIDSTPTSATLYIGDKSCGPLRTPWSGKVQKGPMIVIIEQLGYDPSTRTLTVSGSTDLFVPLVRIEIGGVEIRADSDPNVAGAPIVIDGQAQGTVPNTVKLRAGRHLVEIEKAGFDKFTQWVMIEEAKTLALLPTLHAVTVQKVRLVIDADVVQAEVTVDGVKRGTTPVAIDGLPAGSTHKVLVQKPPAKDWEQIVQLTQGSTLLRAELAATMPRSPTDGALAFEADQPNAEIVVDGSAIGKTPMKTTLGAGDHWIQIRLAGHITFEQKLLVEAGKSYAINAKLVKAGKLTVASTPAGSTVFIDKVRVGSTPYTAELPVGDHVVIVERAGFQRFEQKVKIGEKPIEISAALKR